MLLYMFNLTFLSYYLTFDIYNLIDCRDNVLYRQSSYFFGQFGHIL